ncbi:hypothetical protein AABB24_021518 [Solanum stoloniferum]|uniref:Uncharacterized protein n=1 Tax=Solanum stoloniferum TaxID=62892 RepID=A0ABD2SW23_9SOLN
MGHPHSRSCVHVFIFSANKIVFSGMVDFSSCTFLFRSYLLEEYLIYRFVLTFVFFLFSHLILLLMFLHMVPVRSVWVALIHLLKLVVKVPSRFKHSHMTQILTFVVFFFVG